jgi:hypothetical protein
MSYDTMDYRYNTFVVIWYFSKGAGGNGVYKYAKLVYLVEDESLISLALIKKYLHAPPMQGGGVTKKSLLVGRSTIVVGLFWIFCPQKSCSPLPVVPKEERDKDHKSLSSLRCVLGEVVGVIHPWGLGPCRSEVLLFHFQNLTHHHCDTGASVFSRSPRLQGLI